jgi:hypothetical protein
MHGSNYNSWANEGSNLPAGYNDNGELIEGFTGRLNNFYRKTDNDLICEMGLDKTDYKMAETLIKEFMTAKANGEHITHFHRKIDILFAIQDKYYIKY